MWLWRLWACNWMPWHRTLAGSFWVSEQHFIFGHQSFNRCVGRSPDDNDWCMYCPPRRP